MKGIFIINDVKTPLTKLTYKEELVLKKSMEYFNDEDPCVVHRTYCTNYLAIELMELIEKKYENLLNTTLTELPKEISDYLVIRYNKIVIL